MRRSVASRESRGRNGGSRASRRRRALGFVAAAAGWVLLAGTADARTVRLVPSEYPTIQSAINASVNGDTVLVSPGTYSEHLDFLGKGIVVASEEGPAATIVDGMGLGTVVLMESGEPSSAVLSGFTIRNGNASGMAGTICYGGGLFIAVGATPTISNNVITANRACCSGGGIYITDSAPVVVGNVITDNNNFGCSGGGGGGGIAVFNSPNTQILDNLIAGNTFDSGGGINLTNVGVITIRNNRFIGNTSGQGGAIATGASSSPRIVQNLFVGNSAISHGGAIYWIVPFGTIGPTVLNNTMVGNTAVLGSGIYADGYDAQAKIQNNIVVAPAGEYAMFGTDFGDATPPIVQNNDVVSWGIPPFGGTIPGWVGLFGNISADPQFADPVQGDYHLGLDSPCIDAGLSTAPLLPAADPDGDPRLVDGDGNGTVAVDIGWDEFSPFRPFGTGCAGPSGAVPVLAPAGGSPVLGNAGFGIGLSNAPGGTAAFLLAGFSEDNWMGIPLPFGLFFFGLPECLLWVAPEVSFPATTGGAGPTGGSALSPFPIPAAPSLHGLHLFVQWYVADPGPSLVPAAMSRALDVVVL
ncbi:MAG TPA: right-handed parallel beta-helix repeat-containing protein [Planctomycetota bacterium]|jgi:hypothetical protein|nr:right-handed parallel beta-helix repeat-containing protein [Planctomycetota bacterium]